MPIAMKVPRATSPLSRYVILAAHSAVAGLLLTACGGGGGGDPTPPPPPAPSVTLSADQTTIIAGTSVNLSWTSSNTTSCSASGGWSGPLGTSGSQSSSPITTTTSFTITCAAATGLTATSTLTITVTLPPAPVITLTATPSAVAAGATSSLSWSSTNATTCTASGAWSGTLPAAGSQQVGPLAAAMTYTLSCSGLGGSSQQSVSVDVVPAPTITFSASPNPIVAGSSSTLTWTSTNATACAPGGAWSGAIGTSGSQSVGPLTTTTSYGIACSGVGGTTQQLVVVTVSVPSAPIVTLTVNPSTIPSGASTTLTWSSTGAASCTAGGGWGGAQATSGTQVVGPLTANATYSLVCTGPGGMGQQAVTVTVIPPPPTVTLSALPTVIALQQSTTLSWSTTNAASCSASGSWSGAEATSGSSSQTPATLPATFALTCSGPGGSGSAAATVVAGAPQAVIDSPPSVLEYATVLLDGSFSLDSTTSLQTYSWQQTSGPVVALSGSATPIATFVAPHVTAPSSLVFALTVTDTTGTTSSSSATVKVSPSTVDQRTVNIVSVRLFGPDAGGGHSDYVALDGPPLVESTPTLRLALTGAVQSPTFSLVDANGNVLSSAALMLLGSPSSQPVVFAGQVTIPSVPFRIAATGTTADAQSFAVQSATLLSPMNMSVGFVPSRLSLVLGASGASTLTIYNGGAAATFNIAWTDLHGLLTSQPAGSVTIPASSSATISVPITYPLGGANLIGPTVVVAVSVTGDPNRSGSATLSVWDAIQ